MEEIKNEQAELKTQPVETEKEKGEKVSEASLGKFKDAEALLNAYNSLQSEFTKRCQKVKELEEIIKAGKTERQAAESSELKTAQDNNAFKEQILKDYLKSVVSLKGKAVMLGEEGVGVATPLSKPKTLEQASVMAKDLLNR